MREVTKEEFYSTIGQQNVHPHPEGSYPYTSYFKTPDHIVRGKAVDTMVRGQIFTSYWIA